VILDKSSPILPILPNPVNRVVQHKRVPPEMTSSLKFVVVVPAGGGKTTLSQNQGQHFLDIDMLYNLRETESTYERMNVELQRLADIRQPVPTADADELRRRVKEYKGLASCLMIHSLAPAQASGLRLIGVLIPSVELHDNSISDRDAFGRWFAHRNVDCLVKACRRRSVKISTYSSWTEMAEFVAAWLPMLPARNTIVTPYSSHDGKAAALERLEQQRDEALLLSLCSLAVGCDFETRG